MPLRWGSTEKKTGNNTPSPGSFLQPVLPKQRSRAFPWPSLAVPGLRPSLSVARKLPPFPPLHAVLSPQDQKLVQDQYPAGLCKMVLLRPGPAGVTKMEFCWPYLFPEPWLLNLNPRPGLSPGTRAVYLAPLFPDSMFPILSGCLSEIIPGYRGR